MTKPHTTGKAEGSIMSRTGQLTLLVSALCLAGLAQAELAIQSVTAATQGGGEVIRIQMNEPLKQLPSGFAIQSPARIALDFAGATNATGQNLFEINQGNLRSANVVEAGDRTRVVFNLSQSVGYDTRIDGNALIVSLKQPPVATTAAPAASTSVFAGSPEAMGVQALSDIDFRRGNEGAGRVIVNLANSQTGVDIRQQGRNLVVEFLKTSLPEGLRRRMDVADFGTPVRMITATDAGDRVRLLIEPTGNWEHSAYQSDNQFVLEVREVKADPNKLTQGPNYRGERLTLDFQDIDVRSVLKVIADFTDFNIVTTDDVKGNVTLRLKDVPWDQALDIVLQSKGLGMTKSGNVIRVALNSELAKEQEESFKKIALEQKSIPLQSESFQLNYAKAIEVAAQLQGANIATGQNNSDVKPTAQAQGTGYSSDSNQIFSSGSRILSERGVAVAEPRTNRLFVMDVPDRLQKISELIKLLDVKVRQVMIEARIVEADEGVGKSLGVRLGGVVNGATIGSANNSRISLSLGGASSYGSASPTFDGAMVNLPAQTLTQAASTTAGVIGATIFNASLTRMLGLEISALEADRRVNVIASPRLITADMMKAVIEQGEEIPYSSSSNNGTNVQFKKAVLKLDVKPQITPDGSVILEVEVSKDSRGDVLAGGVAINTNKVQTNVLVQNGGTVAIGGIFRSEESSDVQKIPGLGDIPGLGVLFRSKRNSVDRKELIVFLTPRIISDETGAK